MDINNDEPKKTYNDQKNTYNLFDLKNFVYDNSTGIYVHPSNANIKYEDGGEDYLTNILKNTKDLSSYSLELIQHIKDWPSRYHLSYRRANLLESISSLFNYNSRVLEIGSGCGAITRWLGERFKEVDAVEGSLARAVATKYRIKGLENVKIYCGDALYTNFNSKYDIITLIGVLEYIPLYDKDCENAKESCIRLLERLTRSLSDEGMLIIAIENKLGTKYFSGCTEDHTGKLFDGIAGYSERSAVTFSRVELEKILKAAGFTNIQFYHLFPDYKLTETIILECEEVEELRPYNWIKTPFENYIGDRFYLLPEFLMLKTVTDAGLLWHFSNSFLVLASRSDKVNLKTKWFIKKFYNNEMHHDRMFHHSITLEKSDASKYVVKRYPIAYGEKQIDLKDIEFRLEDCNYVHGELLNLELYRSLLKNNQEQSIKFALKKLHDDLINKYGTGKYDEYNYPMIKGEAIDYTFWNIIIGQDKKLYFIDKKWRAKSDLPVDFVLFRCLYHIYNNIIPYVNQKDKSLFILNNIKELYPQYDTDRQVKNLKNEEIFQSIVCNRKIELSLETTPLYSISQQALRCRMMEKTLSELNSKLQEASIKNSELEHKLNDTLSELNLKTRMLNEEISKRDTQISTLNSKLQEVLIKNSELEHKLNDTLSELNLKTRMLNEEISKRDTQISTLNSKLQEASIKNSELEHEINDMRQSVVWRMLMAYQRIVDIVLPPTTRRGRAYGLGLKCIRIVATKGPGELWLRARNYLKASNNINDSFYEEWIRQNEPSKSELAAIAEDSKKLSYRPLISIIMPVWNTDKKWLCKAIDSVINQTYDRWELCIADGGSKKPHVKKILKDYAKKDSRIKVKFLDENRGIAENSNEALSIATGDFIGLLDHDDELAPFALYEIVRLLNQNLYLDFIYSDEDKIDSRGRRRDPFFKPGWSPDFLLACGYTNHFSIYRKNIVDKLGGFRKDFEGSQDYDLVLRFTESIPQENIAHIPKVLYHWRQIINSTSIDPYAKNSIVINMAKKALEDALRRRNIKGKVIDGLWPSSYHVKRDIIGNPLVTIIIPTKDNIKLLKNCIDSIEQKSTYRNFNIIIVDNNSSEPETLEYLKRCPHKVLSYPDKFNFSRINNFAVKHASGDYIIFLNNDTEVITPDWIEALLEQAQIPGVGAVGCKLLYQDGSIQHAGVVLGMSPDQETGIAGHVFRGFSYEDNGYFGAINVIKNYSAVTAACMMMRKEVFVEAGDFNEILAVCYNDVDLCLRLREKGYRIVYTPYAELFHYESKTRGQSVDVREARYMLDKWGDIIKNDPYYNPNLTLKKYNCELNLK